VTTTAVSQTLSFYGTGQIVLTGTSSATVVGTGAYPSRKTLTFTPTVGVLTLTVTGTVQYAQLEIGAFATSFIPTDGTTKTRNADVATMTGTNFSDWYNASAGTFTTQYSSFAKVNYPEILNASNGTISNQLNTYIDATNGFTVIREFASGVLYANTSYSTTQGTTVKNSIGYSSVGLITSGNASSPAVSNNATHPTGINKLSLGANFAGTTSFLNGYILRLAFYPQRLIAAEIQAFAK
jgi:hypothetical protein